MNQILLFILPIVAVFLGLGVAYIFKPQVANGVKLLLAFSGAFLLSVTVLEFLPEIYDAEFEKIGIFIMLGILLQILLEFLSRGAEHGHLHLDENSTQMPWALFVSLCIHSAFEGFPLSGNQDLLYGVVIHKIPVAVIISTFLLISNISRIKVFTFLLIFALMTPLGSLLGQQDIFSTTVKTGINALVVGILLHVSTTILFESSKNHQFNAQKFIIIILGIFIAYLL